MRKWFAIILLILLSLFIAGYVLMENYRKLEVEESLRLEMENRRLEVERLEAERLEAERLEAERLKAERIEAERLEAERLEAQRLEREQQKLLYLESDAYARIAVKIADVDYSPFSKLEQPPLEPVKGIYITGNTIRGGRFDELITLVEETELNAVVIDILDDEGYLLFKSETAERLNPEANEHVYVEDVQKVIALLKEKNIYVIGRIVTFKSPIYAKNNPDRAISHKDTGKVYHDRDGLLWASPYDHILWEYNFGVAKEAALHGVDEIQFDYVRFPAIARPDTIDYKASDVSQAAIIQAFLKEAYETLTPLGVEISADVFGWVASATGDVDIGQQWEAISNVVDVICPMMYPSHYGPGNFGLPVPDAAPYETIDRSLKDALKRNSNLATPARIRPWLQDFTATWVDGHIRYRAKEVRAQIEALKANGIEEYLIWNAGNYYSENAFERVK
ncbi:MAG: hypothetical protein LCH34_05965 [Firmicutes bacterium]|nr:hypothetical protein [Bacillota bacterium]